MILSLSLSVSVSLSLSLSLSLSISLSVYLSVKYIYIYIYIYIIEFTLHMAHCQQLYLSVIYSFDALHFVNSLTHENFSVAFSLMHQVVKKKIMALFYWWVSRLQCYCKETVYFLQLCPQKFLLHIWLTLKDERLSQRWKTLGFWTRDPRIVNPVL